MNAHTDATSDEDTDDELPKYSTAQLNRTAHDRIGCLPYQNDEIHQQRLDTHTKLRAYEAKRRMAYESKLQSSSLYWHAFRTLMHDSLLETQKVDILLQGWTHASQIYAASMLSVGEWCIDEKGTPVTDPKKKKKLIEVAVASDNAGALFPAQPMRGSLFPLSDKRAAISRNKFYREEVCGTTIQRLADSARSVSSQYYDLVRVMDGDVQPKLSL